MDSSFESHVLDDRGSELREVHLLGALHQTGEVVRHGLVADGAVEALEKTSAASAQPMKRNIISPERIAEMVWGGRNGLPSASVVIFRPRKGGVTVA
jgi:hypothetical protein